MYYFPGCNYRPCRHYGHCVSILYGGFACICPQGYSGKQCEQGMFLKVNIVNYNLSWSNVTCLYQFILVLDN